jgi:serine/threonine protein kinase
MLAPSTAKFAGYRVEGIAGRGGMGVVYKATQLGLDRPVALKVVAAGLLGDPRIRERFLRESRAAAAIEHPNVIPIHDYGECHGRAYIAMRFVDGDDLRERVTTTGPLAPEHAAAIVAHVADALDAAHDAGLVHRDVKPANILLGAHDQVYLSDFGLASHALSEGGLTSPGGWVGTMDFMAPEQIRGGPVDRRADVYALGCVLHFALTGRGRLSAGDRRGAPVGAPARRASRALAARARGAGGVRRGRPAGAGEAAGSPSGLGRRVGCGGPRGGRAPGRRAGQAHSGTPPAATQRRRRDVARRAASRSAPARPHGPPRRPPSSPAPSPPSCSPTSPGTPLARRARRRRPRRSRPRRRSRRAARSTSSPPARRPRHPRRRAAGQRRGRRRQRMDRQHGLPDARRVPVGGHLRRRGPRLGLGITDITDRRESSG